jgi:hypothetical protein
MKFVPCKMIPWEHNTEEVKKVKVGLLEKDALKLHIHGEQFKRK